MSALPKIEIRKLAKAFPLLKRHKAKGIETVGLAALKIFLRQSLLGRAVEITPSRDNPNFLFALDDVTFDVPPGEVLGVIGRNGAGKSTLLKCLARVLEPTEGSATIRGRVVSLLELGVGLAPELTVRENIQICGRLAGIRASQLRVAENRILELARLVPFREVPLQRCPSGSAVQLAFSAMMSFDADIILADEVLAIGDSDFRRDCEDRIRAVGQTGESVLFVSHDMKAIRRTCSRVVWLDKGRIRKIGPTEEVVTAYTNELLMGGLDSLTPGNMSASCRILEIRLLDADHAPVGALQITEPAYIDCVLRVSRPDVAITAQIELWHGKNLVLNSTTRDPLRARRPTTFRAAMELPSNFLNDVAYQARCRLYVRDAADAAAEPILVAEEKMDFTVMNPRPDQSVWSDWNWSRPGVISPRLQWNAIA